MMGSGALIDIEVSLSAPIGLQVYMMGSGAPTNRITSVHDGEWGTHRSFTVSMDMTASVDHGSGQSRHVYIKIKMTFLHKKFIL